MTRGPVDSGDPDRLYTVTGGRSRAHDTTFDPVTFVVGESEPAAGMQSEHVRILLLCQRAPTPVAELCAQLGLPVGVVKVLLADLLAAGRISARRLRPTPPGGGELLPAPETQTLRKVLRALQNL